MNLKVITTKIYRMKICPQCKGRRTVVDVESAIFTIGLSLIFKHGEDDGRKKCPTCKGKGFLEFK